MDHPTDTRTYHSDETIAAISTPIGEGGIGIIRLTGADAVALACRIFRRTDGRPLGNPRPFHLYYGHIIHPTSGEILDEVLLSTMRAPRSSTCEDMAEISAHGGPAPLQAILALLIEQGARLAAPGEFTQRAFLNGRIDLTQAEAVLDVIRARTDAGLRAAQSHLQGKMGQQVRALRERIVALLSSLEATIDFSEDDLVFLSPEEIVAEVSDLQQAVNSLVASHHRGKLLREGARTAIIGRPNTGKSSLLNALLGEARAIVTPIPGTTRDVIEEQVDLGGVPVRLIDTAGIRHTEDDVEKIGVERSHASLEQADLALLVLDGSVPLTKEDHQLMQLIHSRTVIAVLNKADLPARVTPQELANEFSGPIIVLSAQTGEGIDQLEEAMRHLLLGSSVTSESTALANLRQREAAVRANVALAQAQETIANGGSEELLAVDLMAAASALGEITGDDIREEVIGNLFARFCVGK